MASISVSRGIGTLTSARFYKMVALVMVGAFVSTVASDWIRNNVIDLGIPFADAVYAIATVLIVRTLMSGRASLLVAAGAGTGIGAAALDELNI